MLFMREKSFIEHASLHQTKASMNLDPLHCVFCAMESHACVDCDIIHLRMEDSHSFWKLRTSSWDAKQVDGWPNILHNREIALELSIFKMGEGLSINKNKILYGTKVAPQRISLQSGIFSKVKIEILCNAILHHKGLYIYILNHYHVILLWRMLSIKHPYNLSHDAPQLIAIHPRNGMMTKSCIALYDAKYAPQKIQTQQRCSI